MDFCLVKDLCLKIYLQVLNDIYNPTFLKSNIASSPQNYDFSGLPISGKDTNALQWSRLETLVSFSPPSPISCITFCPPEDSGICLCHLHRHPPAHALHSGTSSFLLPPPSLFPVHPPHISPRDAQSTNSAMPVLRFSVPDSLLPRGSGPSFLSGFQHLHKSGSHRLFCLIFESIHVHVSPSVSQLLH